jgi:hypothetical protein
VSLRASPPAVPLIWLTPLHYQQTYYRFSLCSVGGGTSSPSMSRHSFSRAWLLGTQPAARGSHRLFSRLPGADVFLYLGLLLCWQIPCPLTSLCGPWERQVRCSGPTQRCWVCGSRNICNFNCVSSILASSSLQSPYSMVDRHQDALPPLVLMVS